MVCFCLIFLIILTYYLGCTRNMRITTSIIELRSVISNNVAFLQVQTQTSLCSLILSLETSNDVQPVA